MLVQVGLAPLAFYVARRATCRRSISSFANPAHEIWISTDVLTYWLSRRAHQAEDYPGVTLPTMRENLIQPKESFMRWPVSQVHNFVHTADSDRFAGYVEHGAARGYHTAPCRPSTFFCSANLLAVVVPQERCQWPDEFSQPQLPSSFVRPRVPPVTKRSPGLEVGRKGDRAGSLCSLKPGNVPQKPAHC